MTPEPRDRSGDQPAPDASAAPAAVGQASEPTLVEDVLLLLFQPDSGTIAGENILYYVLAGAAVTDLALADLVEARPSGMFSTRVHALGDSPPAADLLVPAWSYISEKPRGVQTVLAATGPQLREPTLERLVDGADVDERTAAAIGLLSASDTLPQFHREIPWSSDVYTRGKEFERGDWGAAAAASAVARTMAAIIASSVVTSVAILPRT